jgi:hypothetical protein
MESHQLFYCEKKEKRKRKSHPGLGLADWRLKTNQETEVTVDYD